MKRLPVTIAVRIDPAGLVNPDLDLRYILADRITETTKSTSEDGYDYVGDEPALVLYFTTDNPDEDVEAIIKLLRGEVFLGNNLASSISIAVQSDREFEAGFPIDASGPFE
jgi:hypothetical protein